MGLSKSRFVSGMQCAKKLYYDVHRKDLRQPVNASKQALFDAGHEVGLLAQSYFPGGKDASSVDFKDFTAALSNTKQWIEEGVSTIYEATFSFGGVLSALDILHHSNGKRLAIEVKSSTEIKDYHYIDAALQYWVMSNAGYAPDEISIMYINKDYRKYGEINPAQFFKIEDVTAKVLAMQLMIGADVARLSTMLTLPSEPVINIGRYCNRPFECDYKHKCWNHIPDGSVFDLFFAGDKAWNLYEQGFLMLSDIPDTFALNHRQQLQVEGAKNGSSYIDRQSITTFLGDWEFPLHFFDFETIDPAIPILEGTSPFQKLPFQYSLHVTDALGNILTHTEFLATPEDFINPLTYAEDPRYKLIQQLKQDIGNKGSIVVYYKAFELGRLKELAIAFPSEAEFINGLIERVVDLHEPFKNGWYYLPEMNGSASIKDVLPSIDPEFSYKDLIVGNGGDASDLYMSMVNNTFDGDKNETISNLLKYCERDTEGMVVIYKEFLNVST